MTRVSVLRKGEGAADPIVDVICPTHNRSTAILSTIQDVLAQTVSRLRLIVVSDGSTDDTDDVVAACSDPRVHLLRCLPHRHPGGPRNIGLDYGTAPFVTYIDHDDHWAPSHVEMLLNALESGHPLVATGSVGIDATGTTVYRSTDLDLAWHADMQVMRAMYQPSQVGHRRDLVRAAGGWKTEPVGFEDWDLWWRLTRGETGFTPLPDRTARFLMDDSTRTSSVRARFALPLARVDTREGARRIIAGLRSPEVTERLAELQRSDYGDWFRRLAESGGLVSPAGSDPDRVLARAPELVGGIQASELYSHLSLARTGDTTVIYRPLWCGEREHAREIRRVSAERDRRQLSHLDGLIRDMDPTARLLIGWEHVTDARG
ncbi:glycosyltransferase family A protein [Nocardiopsis sp. CC223A]|uniref:glycosyltransferase family 2 protein n=1 Tax=Nocardiopsis sp. CC223A TaxID=3044051 RepID=UPI00278BEFC3|nr:glycosyltransferase family A protein [Nocardiopsis sp. CC223A]